MRDRRLELVRILDVALAVEYGALWLLPRHIEKIQDEELKRQLQLVADVEQEHADKSAAMLRALGAEPKEDLTNLRPRTTVKEILRAHIEGEKQSIVLYTRALEVAEDPDMRARLEQMKREEEGHQRLFERALARLGKNS